MTGLWRRFRERDRSWQEEPLARVGRVLIALGPAAFAVAGLHRVRTYESPLVTAGVALIVAGIICLLTARRRHRESVRIDRKGAHD